jgi:hypothetical protein
MITYRKLRTLCPKCNHTLYRGSRVIGPGTVECKACRANISTNLCEWKNLKTSSKIWQVVREIFSPTYTGVDSGSLRIIMTFFIWMLSTIPFVMLMLPFMEAGRKTGGAIGPVGEAFMIVLGTLAMLWYPVLILLRLIRMIRVSNRFLTDGKPPRW